MNFQIFLRKNNIIPVNLALEVFKDDCIIYSDYFSMIDNNVSKIFSIDTKFNDRYKFKISRHEGYLYETNKLTHDSYVIIDKIILDNFWTIDDKNHWSETFYDQEYVSHLRDKDVTWELSKTMYNNILYFNGSLDYMISIPIRGMFFK